MQQLALVMIILLSLGRSILRPLRQPQRLLLVGLQFGFLKKYTLYVGLQTLNASIWVEIML
jgi:hypothetical protein